MRTHLYMQFIHTSNHVAQYKRSMGNAKIGEGDSQWKSMYSVMVWHEIVLFFYETVVLISIPCLYPCLYRLPFTSLGNDIKIFPPK